MQEKGDRSIAELFSELSRETTALLRQEVQLAKAEMTQKASRVGRTWALLVIGVLWPTRACSRSWRRGSYC